MSAEPVSLRRRTLAAAAPLVAMLAAIVCLALYDAILSAQQGKAAAKAVQKSDEKLFEDFDVHNFDRPTQIDNEWLPLKPGTRFVYEGTSVEGPNLIVPHRLVITVTDLTKVIGGVRSVVTWDLDYGEHDALEEAELAFFAQDNDGNVWRMGEYPEEYDGGKFVVASPWLHGLEAARAGIEMQAKPTPGTPSYSQGWGPAVKWSDRGQVLKVGQKTTVRAGTYDDVLVIGETSRSEPNAQQLKYFARGVGNVRVGWAGKGEKTKEVLELVRTEKLDAQALAEVRAAALKLEASGYKHSKTVYAHTPPAEPMSAADTRSTAK